MAHGFGRMLYIAPFGELLPQITCNETGRIVVRVTLSQFFIPLLVRHHDPPSRDIDRSPACETKKGREIQGDLSSKPTKDTIYLFSGANLSTYPLRPKVVISLRRINSREQPCLSEWGYATERLAHIRLLSQRSTDWFLLTSCPGTTIPDHRTR